MASRRLKRPSSARRNIKQETFSPFVSSTRLRNVQALLKGDGAGPDAVLCILGIDSRYNDGMRELLNYLLFGFFENRKFEIERTGYDEEVIDDMMFVIKPHSVDVYCNPINYLFLLPYIAHWRNLHIHCMTDEEYEDDEAAEEFKIKSFIAMVTNFQMIGLPYNSQGKHMQFDKMVVEKWPIVQAYALEGFGGGGFFTMKHEVVDMSEEIAQIYNIMDPFTVETLVTEQLVLFERQWSTMLNNIDVNGTKNVQNLTEGAVSEPLRSYFSHGQVGAARHGRSTPDRYPCVLFGTNTRRKPLHEALDGHVKTEGSVLKDTGINSQQQGQHMVCRAVSPKNPLCCTRTYFFSNGALPYQLSEADKGDTEATVSRDVMLLSQLYASCVDTVLECIHVYASTLSVSKAETWAYSYLQGKCRHLVAKVPLLASYLNNRNNFEFKIEAFNNHGRCVKLRDGEKVSLVKTASLTLYDIPTVDWVDTEHAKKSLGSVSFAESFLESTITVLKEGGGKSIDAQFTVLTAHIPRFVSWAASTTEHLCHTQIVSALKDKTVDGRFTQPILYGETAQLTVENNTCGFQEVALYLYETTLVLEHSRWGTVVLPKSHIEKLHYYDGDSARTVALLVITPRASVQLQLPAHLRSKTCRLILAFKPKSRAYKALYSQVLPLWKQQSQTVEVWSTLPEELAGWYRQLQHQYMVENTGETAPPSALRKVCSQLPDLHRFLDHFAVGSVGTAAVPEEHITPVLNHTQEGRAGPDETAQLIITILTGLPGSHKEDLCNTLIKLAKEESRWATLRQPIDDTYKFDPVLLQRSLTASLQAHRRRKPGISTKTKRALVVTPGFTDVVDVIQAIATHPDPDIAQHLRIGAVTACVDPLHSYMSHRYLLPKLLEQCAQGWVNNIVFTSSTNPKNTDLEEIQQLVRAANWDVALLLANRGEVSRSTDIDLILSETAFSHRALLRARYLSCPGWCTGQFNTGPIQPGVCEVATRFSQPLDKHRFLTRLKGLKSSMADYPFTGNVYYIRGKVKFSDSPQLFEVRFVPLSGFLNLTQAELQPMPPTRSNGPANHAPSNTYCVIFTGCGLDESKLKEWLRACGRQKPEKKVLRTRDSVTRQELKKIHEEHHLDALPEGWFYNGSRFVSLAGDKSDMHPNMDNFVEDYIKSINREIEKYNARIDDEEYTDLFD